MRRAQETRKAGTHDGASRAPLAEDAVSLRRAQSLARLAKLAGRKVVLLRHGIPSEESRAASSARPALRPGDLVVCVPVEPSGDDGWVPCGGVCPGRKPRYREIPAVDIVRLRGPVRHDEVVRALRPHWCDVRFRRGEAPSAGPDAGGAGCR